jgi:two-component system, NtrC family, sensor histidine kinase HydH
MLPACSRLEGTLSDVLDSSAESRSLTRNALDRMLAKAIRVRMAIAPVLGSLALTFAFFESVHWRRVLLASAVTLMFSLSVVEFARHRRYGLSVVQVPVNVVITVLAQLALLTGSGGLFSPVVPAVILMVVITALLAQRRALILLLCLITPYFWALSLVHYRGWPVASLMPSLFGGTQPIEHSPAPFIAAGLYTTMLATTARVGRALQQLFESLFGDAMRERDRSLALHAEQSRALTMLTSEIAHELKNPLASIKGLAALVAKDVEGRASERMRVLRGEVDRMQTILEEFLNLSRPLVPLSLADTDLSQLAREVVLLHEGSASERGVQIVVEGESRARLRCDPRKVRQVLINLLQNALEVSPRSSQITVRVESQPDGLCVQVIDHGPGLLPQIEQRAFEAGVTSKEQGSGIGLVVARSLARQHGGDVELSHGAHGGLVAGLLLPIDPQLAKGAAQ